MAAVTLDVAACVVACILSCRLLVTPERMRGEVGEHVGYLTGEADPFSSDSEAAKVDLAGEDKTEARGVPFDAMLASIEDLIVDKFDIVRTEGGEALDAEVSMDLKGKLELYMFIDDLGESGGVIDIAERSSMDPTCAAGEALEASVAARALTEAGSVPVLRVEGDIKVAEVREGYCPC